MSIQSGPYMIIKGSAEDGSRLTLLHDDKVTRGGYLVTVQPPNPVGQKWLLTEQSNGNFVIENVDYKLESGTWYLVADVHIDRNLSMDSPPFEWHFQQSKEKNRFHIVVPGGPVSSAGSELAVDQKDTGIKGLPLVAALRPLDVDNIEQTWLMIPAN